MAREAGRQNIVFRNIAGMNKSDVAGGPKTVVRLVKLAQVLFPFRRKMETWKVGKYLNFLAIELLELRQFLSPKNIMER